MDTVFIERLELLTIIGVHAWEQRAPRPLWIDIEMDFDARPAANSDQLRDTIDYYAVCADVRAIAAENRIRLIETFAETIARRLFERHPIVAARIKVSKPGAVPDTRCVAVRVDRRREDYAGCGI